MSPPARISRLLQLASPSLPIGSYAYSQGLETAVEQGWVCDEASLAAWVHDQLHHSLGQVDLPVCVRLCDAVRREDVSSQQRWVSRLNAMRETRELAADDCDRGRALARLLTDLGLEAAAPWRSERTPLALPWALVTEAWQIALRDSLEAYAWGWLENQVLCGVKLVPLGQVAGQRLLLELAAGLPELVRDVLERDDDEIGGTLPIVALASTLHETQYARLYRS